MVRRRLGRVVFSLSMAVGTVSLAQEADKAPATPSPAAGAQASAQAPAQGVATTTTKKVFDKPFVDPRLTNIRSLYQGSGFSPKYTTEEQWKERAGRLREQVLVSAGLWPLPPRPPLEPVVTGTIDKGDYTIERVYFQSHPKFYVTGNLYRPKGKTGPFPAVMSPHGHWANGRLYKAADREVERQLKAGEEVDKDAATYPNQARAVGLAKLGCIVFFYDMVGYADAYEEAFPHRKTFVGGEYDQQLLSVFGLQTWDSLRVMDFLCSLPDVDQKRIACTGESGGGTQTFVMMALDDRLKVAAPVCMISHDNHQGGCVCENNSLFRLGTDNVEISSTFAPRPFIHPTTTGDWTKEYLEKGYPETQLIYALFGEKDKVQAMRQTAPHNYNLKSREAVYNFFNQHLKLGHEGTLHEQKFEPVDLKELAVFDEKHPRPTDASNAETLKNYLVTASMAQLYSLKPGDAAGLERFKYVVGTALRHMLFTSVPLMSEVGTEVVSTSTANGITVEKVILSRKDSAEKLPALVFVPQNGSGTATVVVHPEEKEGLLDAEGKPGAFVKGLLEKGHIVVAPDVFLTGELHPGEVAGKRVTHNSAEKVEFFAGYNRTTIANRVHDILTTVACAKARSGVQTVNLVGYKYAGPWALLARTIAGDRIHRVVVDGDLSGFDRVAQATHYDFLPGSKKYGGLWVLGSVGAPNELFVHKTGSEEQAGIKWLVSSYEAAGASDKLRIDEDAEEGKIVEWLTR